jgi:hypothetical protein
MDVCFHRDPTSRERGGTLRAFEIKSYIKGYVKCPVSGYLSI